MRFISKFAGYTIGFQVEFVQYLQDGGGRTVQNVLTPLLDCKFRLESLYPWEVEAAKGFVFNGGLVEADEMTPVNPTGLDRVSVFDTDAFSRENNLDAETKAKLEQHLLSNAMHGIDFKVVDAPIVPKPWPSYDKIRGGGAKSTAEKIVEQVVELGFNTLEGVEQIVAYEQANAARKDVIDALNGLVAVPEEEQEELVSA